MNHTLFSVVAIALTASAVPGIPQRAHAQSRVTLSADFDGEQIIGGRLVKTSLCRAIPVTVPGRSVAVAANCDVRNPIWGTFVDSMIVTASSNALTGSPELRSRSKGIGFFTQSVNEGDFSYASDINATFRENLILTRGTGADFFRFNARLTGNIAVDPHTCTQFGCAPPSVFNPFQRVTSSASFTTALGACAVGGTGLAANGGVGVVSNLLVCDVPIRAFVDGRLDFELGFQQLLRFRRSVGQGASSSYRFDLDFMNTMQIESIQAFDAANTDITARYGFAFAGLPNINVVPEPASLALLSSGIVFLGVIHRGRRRRQRAVA